jgi:RNA polymerase sigma-70 factor, ECF subfamily
MEPAGLTQPHARATRLDPESRRWLVELRSEGPDRNAAIARLHALLLRAARFEVFRRAEGRSPRELQDLAVQSADDALVAVLAKLDHYRGESRFTSWAYKFALYEAAAASRRRNWRAREIPVEPEAGVLTASSAAGPEDEAGARELLSAVRKAIDETLSEHQRRVLLAVTVEGVPIDVLAERLGTTRGALYKTVHDARRKLRSKLAEQGLEVDQVEWQA